MSAVSRVKHRLHSSHVTYCVTRRQRGVHHTVSLSAVEANQMVTVGGSVSGALVFMPRMWEERTLFVFSVQMYKRFCTFSGGESLAIVSTGEPTGLLISGRCVCALQDVDLNQD